MIIAFTGKAGSGKTTIANALAKSKRLKERGILTNVYSFASEIKRIARVEFGWDGQKDERGRRLLQLLGTEVGRAYDPDIWIKKAFNRIDKSIDMVSIIDDCRFDNEAYAILERGGAVISLNGRASEIADSASIHESESGVALCLITRKYDNSKDGTDNIVNDIVDGLFNFYLSGALERKA